MVVKRGKGEMRVREWWRACDAPVGGQIAVEGGHAHLREVESMQSTCSQTDSDGKERCASERWGACNGPEGGQMAVERGGCASERRRACNVPVAKPVEGGDACQREVESVQRTCSWTDSGRVCNRGRGDQQQSLGKAEPSYR